MFCISIFSFTGVLVSHRKWEERKYRFLVSWTRGTDRWVFVSIFTRKYQDKDCEFDLCMCLVSFYVIYFIFAGNQHSNFIYLKRHTFCSLNEITSHLLYKCIDDDAF